MEFCGPINYLLFFFVLGGFTMVLSILSAKLAPHFSPVFSMKSCGETRVILKKKKEKKGMRKMMTTIGRLRLIIFFLFFSIFIRRKIKKTLLFRFKLPVRTLTVVHWEVGEDSWRLVALDRSLATQDYLRRELHSSIAKPRKRNFGRDPNSFEILF